MISHSPARSPTHPPDLSNPPPRSPTPLPDPLTPSRLPAAPNLTHSPLHHTQVSAPVTENACKCRHLWVQEQMTWEPKASIGVAPSWNGGCAFVIFTISLTNPSFTLRLESEHKRLKKLLATARDAGDQHKNEAERLQNVVEEMKAKHETDVAQARKHAAGLARDKSDLQQAVDAMKTEVARAGRLFPRFGSPLTPNGAAGSDFVLTPAGDDNNGDMFTGGASTNRRKLDASAIFRGLRRGWDVWERRRRS
ncbi:hypothetical protein Hypma_002995 [Hypsizygus marmoreus]|uniref:Uncharacterized protein n=1 Tax=Hypsizygus marmoreus TaxID=39966 RepID=A0A369JA21_HYPMA|nr:hypothetical protein Hypma_002995 [Hypsizygus marmoreus]